MIPAEWMRRRAGGIYYGWWIALAGMGIKAIATGLLMNAYGAYVVVMQAEFGWSRTAFSVAFSLQRVESGLLGPIHGWMLDRFGPRPVMTLGMILFGGGFILFSQINTLWTFYATFLITAIGVSLCAFMSIATTIANWFNRFRATAMATSNVGLGIGGLFVPVIALSLNTYGWRATAFASGVFILLVGIPLVQLFRPAPEPYGLLPDGDTAEPPKDGDDEAPRVVYDDSADFTPRQAFRTRAFWLLSSGHAIGVLVVGVVMVHAMVHMSEGLGYSLTTAASVIALLTAASIVGNITGGFAGDRVNKRYLAAFCLFCSGIALILLGWAESSIMVIAFAVLQGWAHGARGTLMMPIRADYFGRKSLATIMGFSSLIIMWGMITGPILAGLAADILGDYRLAFTLLGIFALAGSICFVFATKPVHPSQRRKSMTA